MGRKQGDTDQYQPDTPGWYPDPWSATGGGERYFDGKRWGTTERPRGRLSTNVVTMKPPRVRGFKAPRDPVPDPHHPVPHRRGGGRPVDPPGGATQRRVVPRRSTAASASPDRRREPRKRPTGSSPKPAPVSGPGEFEFQRTQPDQKETPVAFDPCRPIHWVYNPAGGPPDGEAIVQDSFPALAAATGLRFVR